VSKERVAILGIALAFYALGGWSQKDFRGYELAAPKLLGYKYIAGDVLYEVKHTAAQGELAGLFQQGRNNVKVNYKLEDPAVAVLVDDPNNPHYSLGMGLIGFGTLMALVREIVLRRRGKYSGEALPPHLRSSLFK
jgi:hypothetical protein